MSEIIHTLLGARPPARSDGEPWNRVRIEHAELDTGPWVEDDTQELDPLDTDPSDPAKRDLTFVSEEAEAFFRLVFLDALDQESVPTDPVYDDGSGIEWRPTVADVAAVLVSRTFVKETLVGSDDNLAGTFTADTRPTADQVKVQIAQALTELAPRINETEDTSEETYGLIRVAAARRAAMLVFISYFSEELEDANSAYDELRQLYLDALEALKASGGDTNATSTGVYSIPMRSEAVDAYCAPDLVP